MLPPPDDCPDAAGAAANPHKISAQAPRFAGRRVSRKLLRPLLFGCRPTGLADGLAPEEQRYYRDIPVDSPLEGRPSNGSPVPRGHSEVSRGFGKALTRGSIPPGQAASTWLHYEPGRLLAAP